jgi:hypothetical protein
VLAQLLAAEPVDRPRVVHHAVAAGDDAVVVAQAPRAAEDAYRAGSHAQEIRFYEELLRRRELLAPAAEAQVLQACATARFTTDRLADALAASTAAVEIRERLGDPAELAAALAGLASIQWALTGPGDAGNVAAGRRAPGRGRRHPPARVDAVRARPAAHRPRPLRRDRARRGGRRRHRGTDRCERAARLGPHDPRPALGDPYSAALELAEGDYDARLAALTRLHELGAALPPRACGATCADRSSP